MAALFRGLGLKKVLFCALLACSEKDMRLDILFVCERVTSVVLYAWSYTVSPVERTEVCLIA